MSKEHKTTQLNRLVGAVVIGRNEGMRLVQCLKSLLETLSIVYYVDSGSSDDSVERASELGAHVIKLDTATPFTAARARNEGWLLLTQKHANVKFIQFVDGDCEVAENWLPAAFDTLSGNSNYAAVCGRRRERFPDASIYNKLCDIEWDTPIGEVAACGGDAMMRIDALVSVDGFNPSLVACEEPELCVRLRERGWRIFRIDMDMTLHDAAIMSFTQWWRRSVRAGHAFAEGAHMHGSSPARHWIKESRRILLWGGVLPLLIAGSAVFMPGLSLILLAGYPLSAFRAYQSAKVRGWTSKEAAIFGVFCTIGKIPEFAGMCRFYLNHLRRAKTALIEYKK